MALFIYPKALHHDVGMDLHSARVKGARAMGVEMGDMRHAIRALMNHKLLLLPAQVDHHDASVDRVRQVALLCGIDVRPITTYKQPKPTPAPAARHNQPGVGVGNR